MRQPKIGKQILEIVTSGMYSHAMMALREYIQNSVDAIDEAIAAGVLAPHEAVIDVDLDGATRTIQITDNGIAVSPSRVEDRLCGCGITAKRQDRSRGFRGIGRLGGLGYCDAVLFETRRSCRQRVSVVTWDGKKLRDACKASRGDDEAIAVLKRVVNACSRPGRPGDADRFFRVILRDVHQFHTDALMNELAVIEYLSLVGPVPFDSTRFSFAPDVEAHLSEVSGYRTYAIRVNGSPVYRPHTHVVPVSGQSLDTIKGVELFGIRGRNGREIGRGWYAKTSCIASIPPRVSMRGLRVRQGNIEIGDDQFLAEWFTERRFAHWHIGEIHLDYTLKANARRDGFEQSPDYEAFLEHAHSLGKHLSHLCRAASKARSHKVAVTRMLDRVDGLISQPFFLDEGHADETVATAVATLDRLELMLDGLTDGAGLRRRLAAVKKRLDRVSRHPICLHDLLDGRSLTHSTPKGLLTAVAKRVLSQHGKHRSPGALLAAVLLPYLTAKGRRLSSSRDFTR